MRERLLQFIWQFQYFNSSHLYTSMGTPVKIIKPGNYNTNQGPDFLNAKIKVGDTLWAGSVEIHVKASEWNLHGHSGDENYKNVILHVVWELDVELPETFPCLVLQDRVPVMLLERYDGFMQSSTLIPCASQINKINNLSTLAWEERLVAERLLNKTKIIAAHLAKNKNHWEETFWWMLARNFGIKINMDAFEEMAKSIPVSLLAKNKNQIQTLEALLFGQANMLGPRLTESYPVMLYKEYAYLKRKYNLTPQPLPIHFLRMRPANFPSVRLAQLAMLIHKSQHLFSTILEAETLTSVKKLLNVTANDYWHYHYQFDEESEFKPKKIGEQMQQNLLINTIIPCLFAYGNLNKKIDIQQKAINWLQELPAEKNKITRAFESLGLKAKSAFDSQYYIQLNNAYCQHKKCLQCSIGNQILKEAAAVYQL